MVTHGGILDSMLNSFTDQPTEQLLTFALIITTIHRMECSSELIRMCCDDDFYTYWKELYNISYISKEHNPILAKIQNKVEEILQKSINGEDAALYKFIKNMAYKMYKMSKATVVKEYGRLDKLDIRLSSKSGWLVEHMCSSTSTPTQELLEKLKYELQCLGIDPVK